MRFRALFLSTLLASPALLAQRIAEVEPNDTAATAQIVRPGDQVDASLTAGEQDWFAFTISSPLRIRMHTSAVPSSVTPHADTRLQLWDATGTTVLAIDDDARGTNNGWTSEITLELTAGTYALQVIGFDGTITGAYSLDIASLTSVVYSGTEAAEPNDSVATATPTTLATGTNLFRGNLAAPTPVLADTTGPTSIVTSSTVVSSTTTVITVTGPLVASAWVGGAFAVQMTSGPNAGLIRTISSNTTTTITTASWPTANTAGNTFDVLFTSSTTGIVATTALTPGAWTPTTTGFGRYQVRFTSGVNAGLWRQIASNTATFLTVTAFPAAPAAGDTFVVELVDADYWQVVLTAPHTGVWFQINEGDAPSALGHRYEVLDAAGTPVVTGTLGANNGVTSALQARTTQTRVWPAGTYHLVVRTPVSTLTTTAPNAVMNPFGNYSLELYLAPMDTSTVAETEAVGGPQSNNTAATAIPIAPGQTGQGHVTNSTGTDPSDWWGPIVLGAPATLFYQTRQGAATALQDSTINLRDANGAIVLASTTGNILSPTSHARGVVTTFLTPATYFLEVVSPGTAATQTGNYELQIGVSIPAPYTLASFTNLGANGPACHSTVVASQTATAGTTTSLTVAGPLPVNGYTNGAFWVRMTSGPNSGSTRAITANTATGITTPAFPTANAAGNTFDIVTSPSLVREFPSEVPALGSLFVRQISSCPAGAIYVHMIGFSNTLYAGATPLPFDMGVFGAPGCTLDIDAVILTVGFCDANGTAQVETPLPGTTALRGFVWYEQGIVNVPAANSFGAVLTNAARAIAGERTY